MIDPVHSLAFSVQANPGVYAVLLGSGVSRASKIPTGWEVTLDLIRKLAKLHGETSDPDPEHWYREKFKQEANYSDLLDELARTPAERQQLLRAYWEPNEQEREDGEKQPTAAHRAIAALTAQGFIKVIITTNFDRLVETALNDEGVVPTVLSSPDQVQGALPLIHTKCCVFKVHGDYLDTRIRNTPAELDQYPPEFDQLLDRIFDEFGLIVCGWSAEWDGALRSALNRAPSRRFTTYWAARGEPGDKAQKLIDHRGAQVIPIEDADTFFQSIQQNVESIEEFSRPHPLSTEAAVASLKRYIAEPRYRIQLSDLIDQTVERVIELTSGEDFAVEGGPTPTSESTTARVRSYDAACSTLLPMALIGSFWVEEEHYSVWQRALQRLGSRSSRDGLILWLELQPYPATLLLYALGLSAVEAGRLQFLKHLLATTVRGKRQEDLPSVRVLPPSCLFSRAGQEMQILEGMDRHFAPLNDWIHDTLRSQAASIIPDDNRYTLAFDKLEILMALSFAYHDERSPDWYWTPPGAFGYRHENRNRILQEIEESLSTMQAESPYVTSGIFGETVEECNQGVKALKKFIPRLGWR
ncbi:MAG: SIR2 family protein [Candidatus Poribacteria bacterium]|nr:SIR2 family protein [Candidatus Poribacteria bacterium]